MAKSESLIADDSISERLYISYARFQSRLCYVNDNGSRWIAVLTFNVGFPGSEVVTYIA